MIKVKIHNYLTSAHMDGLLEKKYTKMTIKKTGF